MVKQPPKDGPGVTAHPEPITVGDDEEESAPPVRVPPLSLPARGGEDDDDASRPPNIPSARDREQTAMLEFAEYEGNVNQWRHVARYDTRDPGTTFRTYKRGSKNFFAQNFGDAFVADRSERENYFRFTCALCHSLREEERNDVLLHVCTLQDAERDWHYVHNCVAFVCIQCRKALEQKLYCELAFACINCRGTDFYNLNFEKKEIHGSNDDLHRQWDEFTRSEVRLDPEPEPEVHAKNWPEFCAEGMGNNAPMTVAMTSLVGAELAHPQGPLPLPYWQHPNMNHLVGLTDFLRIPNFAQITEFQDWFRHWLRPHWVSSRWYFEQNRAYAELSARLHGMAPQCPQNQPFRHMVLTPCFLEEEYWLHVQQVLSGLINEVQDSDFPSSFWTAWTPPRVDAPGSSSGSRPPSERGGDGGGEPRMTEDDAISDTPESPAAPEYTRELCEEAYRAIQHRAAEAVIDDQQGWLGAYARTRRSELDYGHPMDILDMRRRGPLLIAEYCPRLYFQTTPMPQHWETLYVEQNYWPFEVRPSAIMPSNVGHPRVNTWPPCGPIPFQLTELEPFHDWRNDKTLADIPHDVLSSPSDDWTRNKYNTCLGFNDETNEWEYTLPETVWTLLGYLKLAELPPSLKEREKAEIERQSRGFPRYMRFPFRWANQRPNLNVVTGRRQVSVERAITHALNTIWSEKLCIIGFFDVTLGTRIYRNAEMLGSQYGIRNGALEMSFAPAIRNWTDEVRRDFTRQRVHRFVDAEFFEAIKPLWRPNQDVLHFMVQDDPNWDLEWHQRSMGPGFPEYSAAYKRAFLSSYVREEHNFVYHHDIGWFPRWSVLSKGFVWNPNWRSKWWGLTNLLRSDAEKVTHYPSAYYALELVRTMIRETIHVTGYDPSGSAIAVASNDAADYLRRAVGYAGPIIYLEALDYPGLDQMQGTYLAHFPECGMDKHLPNPDPEYAWKWSPTMVRRADDSVGYIKCTMRHVLAMRHWTELWYPVCLAQAKFFDKATQTFNYERWTEFWDHYFWHRNEELKRIFPYENPWAWD